MKKINYRITGTTSRSLLGACLVSVFMFFSCARENTDPQTGGNGGEGNNLSLDTRAVPIAVANNARVYMFTGGTSNTLGNYNHQILNIARTTNDLRMIARAGTWDIALLSASTATDLNNVIAPTVGTAGGAQKMFELAPSGGNLPSAPDLLTAYIDEQVIIADADNTASTSFAHNMAKVQLTIVDAKGLVTTANAHTISLGNVPTTLAWDGKLYPSKTNPTVSTTKMTGSVTVSNVAGGLQESSMLTFLVPAHRGTDFLAANPIDTTTSKLTVSVNLPLSGGGSYLKSDVVIPKVPRAGQILNVRLLIQGELTIESNILDWTNVDTNAGLSNTTLQVSKTNVALSSTDSLIVKTNASSYSVAKDPAGTWFTATQSGERIVISATTSSYTAPRSSWIDITANNVTKRIAINQRPDVGTISVSQSPIWMSPSTGNTTRTVVVNSTGPWTTVSSSPLANATQNVTSGNAGNTNVTFTRKSNPLDNGDYSMYGPQTWTIRNSSTLETINVTVDNYFIYPTDVYITPPRISADTTVVGSGIEIYGYNESFTVVSGSAPSWVISATPGAPGAGTITVRAQREPQDEYREGFITIAHGGDPTYRVQIKLIQDILVLIPPFDYFVLKYTWINNDVDIEARFEGNGMVFDNKNVGWSRNSMVQKDGTVLVMAGSAPLYNTADSYAKPNTILRWGGDALGGEGETIFFNAPLFEGDNNLPRYIKLVCYATWYTTTRSGSPVRTTLFAYLGGTMQKNQTNFDNNGGVQLYTNTRQQQVSSGSGRTYIKLVTITYDRIKHSAQIVWEGTELNTPLIATPTRSAVQQSMSAEEHKAAIAKKQAEWEAANNK